MGDGYTAKLTAEGLYIRERGRIKWYGPLSWGWLHLQGAKVAASEQIAATKKGEPKRVKPRMVSRGLITTEFGGSS